MFTCDVRAYIAMHRDKLGIDAVNIVYEIWSYVKKSVVINYKIGWVTCGFRVADAISDIFISIGTRVSYKVGACNMMPAVPTMTAIVNNHRNRRSKTIATYFQSSFT